MLYYARDIGPECRVECTAGLAFLGCIPAIQLGVFRTLFPYSQVHCSGTQLAYIGALFAHYLAGISGVGPDVATATLSPYVPIWTRSQETHRKIVTIPLHWLSVVASRWPRLDPA